MSNKSAAPQHLPLYDPTERRIRSFVTRAGRLSTGQVKAIETYAPQFCLPYQKEALDFGRAFGRQAPTVLEALFAELFCLSI